jgi:ABC-2 type transport system permease protein
MTADTEVLNAAAPAPPRPDRTATPPVLAWFRTLYWSLRRELWEHPSVWMAPLTVAGLALVGFVIGTLGLPQNMHASGRLSADARTEMLIAIPYVFVAFAVVLTGLVVAVFYAMSALHNERRDRSVLFWKSLPVSDITTVVSKAAVPMVILPVVTMVVILASHILMLAWSAVLVAARGDDLATWWSHAPVLKLWPMLLGGLPFIAAWYAPLYGWLIMVSAWARRAPFLWAVAPPLALGLVEALALSTTTVWRWLGLRLTGAFAGAFGGMSHGRHMGAMDNVGWASPETWIGLVLAAAFFAAAIWLRRSRDPI